MTDRTPRRWMITGVSTGLGQSLMEAVIRHGDTVVGTMRSIPADSETAQSRLVRLDVTDPASVERAIAEATGWLGGIDVLVNNAGAGVFGVVEACDDADFGRAMEVNYYGLLRVTRAALPHLRASRGNLVNVSSMSGFIGMGGTSPYAAAKHAVVGVSESLADELAPLGVKVTVVLPGGFTTNFWSAQSNVIRETMADVYGDYPCGQIGARTSQHAGNEIGDPVKFAETLIDIIGSEKPPLYFVAGADAMEYVGAKLEAMSAELERNRAASVATAFG